jgi:hypothetical protein
LRLPEAAESCAVKERQASFVAVQSDVHYLYQTVGDTGISAQAFNSRSQRSEKRTQRAPLLQGFIRVIVYTMAGVLHDYVRFVGETVLEDRVERNGRYTLI